MDKHGETVPPYKETQDYVLKVNGMAGSSLQTRGSAIYKTTDVVDGREVPRYSDHKPSHGRLRGHQREVEFGNWVIG